MTNLKGFGRWRKRSESCGQGHDSAKSSDPQVAAVLANSMGWTTLMSAAFHGSVASTKLLLEAGFLPAAVTSGGHNALMVAALCGNDDVLQILLKHGAVAGDGPDLQGYTALMFACANCSIGTIEALINHGANVNAQSWSGVTPLSTAKLSGRLDVVRLLRDRNAAEGDIEADARVNELKAAIERYYNDNNWLAYPAIQSPAPDFDLGWRESWRQYAITYSHCNISLVREVNCNGTLHGERIIPLLDALNVVNNTSEDKPRNIWSLMETVRHICEHKPYCVYKVNGDEDLGPLDFRSGYKRYLSEVFAMIERGVYCAPHYGDYFSDMIVDARRIDGNLSVGLDRYLATV